MRFFVVFLVWLSGLFAELSAQNLFAVKVGSFLNVTAADFERLAILGYVHANPQPNGMMDVYLGRYNQASEAAAVAGRVSELGYSNAAVVAIDLSGGSKGFIVQMQFQRGDRPVDWEKMAAAGPLFLIIEATNIKIVTGIFRDMSSARSELPRIRSLGYSDAFIKEVNAAELHPVGNFERNAGGSGAAAPKTYDVPEPAVPATPPESRPAAVPVSRRASVEDLQRFLRSENLYTGSLDGIYGSGTATAINSFERRDPLWRQYLEQARLQLAEENRVTETPLRQALDNFLTDQRSNEYIQRENRGIALAYRAYEAFLANGPGEGVDALMNMAITQVYSNFPMGSIPPFDFQRKYQYADIDLIVSHIHYLHHAPGQEESVPCWLFERHPRASASVYTGLSIIALDIEKVSRCNPITRWESIQAMLLLADKMSASGRSVEIPQFNALLMAVYPDGVSKAQMTELESWHKALWAKIRQAPSAASAAQRDLMKCFRLSYLLNRVYLEDHYLTLGFDADQSRFLAIRWLQNALTGKLEAW